MEKQNPPSNARFPSKRKVSAPESFERAPRGRFLSNIKVPIQIAQLSGRDGERTQPKAAALHLIIKCPGNLGRRVVQWPTPAPDAEKAEAKAKKEEETRKCRERRER